MIQPQLNLLDIIDKKPTPYRKFAYQATTPGI